MRSLFFLQIFGGHNLVFGGHFSARYCMFRDLSIERKADGEAKKKVYILTDRRVVVGLGARHSARAF